uniref:Uncharacterized protein n=1 Tax=Glossina pallidipes TaxID=7398 RepID=A0A1A9ZAC6_GLOPL
MRILITLGHWNYYTIAFGYFNLQSMVKDIKADITSTYQSIIESFEGYKMKDSLRLVLRISLPKALRSFLFCGIGWRIRKINSGKCYGPKSPSQALQKHLTNLAKPLRSSSSSSSSGSSGSGSEAVVSKGVSVAGSGAVAIAVAITAAAAATAAAAGVCNQAKNTHADT